MSDLPRQLREDLTTALRARDRDQVRVLRTVLSAIANAEAQPDQNESPMSLRSEGAFAGAAQGLGATEVARRELDADQIRAVVAAERAERLTSADELIGHGAVHAADALRADAAFLDRYLD